MRDAATVRAWSSPLLQSAVSPRAVAVFCQHILQRPNIQRLVGHDRLQPPVLLFQLPQPAHLGDLQPAVPVPPGVKGRVRDPVPPAQPADLRSRLGFLKDTDNLLLAKPYSFHACLPFRQTLTHPWVSCRG